MHPKIPILKSRMKRAFSLLESCRVCPRKCGANRIRGETGFCGEAFLPRISSDNLHFGEEPPISGSCGSGTVFLTGCSLRCVFCQNYPISQLGHGNTISIPQLAKKMLRLERAGAHNINWVTPTHFIPQLMAALFLASKSGLNLPIVYNSSGYDSVESLELLDGIVDVYLPDMKYADEHHAKEFSDAPGYPEINRAAVLEMFRQTGHLRTDENGIAVRGLVIRHLILPGWASGTHEILTWIRDHLGRKTHISLMRQYFPTHKALGIEVLNQQISDSMYAAAKTWMEELGLENGWIQE
jgi:putative pyruvate formate lyase activating enzyme